MKISYNESKNTIKINDGAKNQYFLVRTMVVLTFINSLLFLSKLSNDHFAMMAFIWIILGITSLVLSYFLFLKLSAAEELSCNEIDSLKEKNVLGRKRLSLRLKNGKSRNLITGNHAEIVAAKTFFARHGVQIKNSTDVL
ncbi:hypothetical protein [Salinimicrobium sp. GXAS 041]|uniref:hypothetical protein n=1 Tax=Salinimicrobium sp. GXAS 041 TaxID=3400806 RepID=UPI003C789ECE